MDRMLNVGEAVRSLFVTHDGANLEFGGTGFFVNHEKETLLVTANHVAGYRELFTFVPRECLLSPQVVCLYDDFVYDV